MAQKDAAAYHTPVVAWLASGHDLPQQLIAKSNAGIAFATSNRNGSDPPLERGGVKVARMPNSGKKKSAAIPPKTNATIPDHASDLSKTRLAVAQGAEIA